MEETNKKLLLENNDEILAAALQAEKKQRELPEAEKRKLPADNLDNFRLLTPRLELRPHRLDDVDFMMELNSDAEVTRYVPDGPLANSHQAIAIIESLRTQFLERQIGRFIVIEKQTGKKIGWCGLKYLEDTEEIDLGYRFLKSVWGQGFASEAANACLAYGFNKLNFDKITARIAPANSASINLAKKLGMRETGTVIEDEFEFLVFEIQTALQNKSEHTELEEVGTTKRRDEPAVKIPKSDETAEGQISSIDFSLRPSM